MLLAGDADTRRALALQARVGGVGDPHDDLATRLAHDVVDLVVLADQNAPGRRHIIAHGTSHDPLDDLGDNLIWCRNTHQVSARATNKPGLSGTA